MANERLVSAEQVYEIARLRHHDFAKSLADLTSLRDVLEDCDTVDAVPVVHCRWIWSEENECWVCSNCEMSALNNYRGNSTDSNYCPHCGAKMDGGNEDG